MHTASDSLSFTCLITIILVYLRKTLHISSKTSARHVLHVSMIQFQTQALYPFAWYGGLSYIYDHLFINKWMLALEQPVRSEKTTLTNPEVQAVVTTKA